MRHVRRALALLLFVLVVGSVAPVNAEPPVTLSTTSQVTDNAGVLGGRVAEVDSALEDLRQNSNVQLFVVFVDSFDGMDSQAWADEVAAKNGLGLNDVVLAVAVQDRQYAWSVDEQFPLSDATLAQVAAEQIEPALQSGDWAGAGVAAARGYDTALSASSSGNGESGGSSFPWCWCLFIPLLLAVGVYLIVRSRRKHTAGEAGPGEQAASVEDLSKRAAALLVEVDDAIKTSEQEVSFATAEFGDDAAAPFRGAVEAAKADLAEAFRLHNALMDSTPEDAQTTYTMLSEIVARTERADAALDAQADAFDALRDKARRADEILAATRARLEQIEATLPEAAPVLAELRSRYPTAALGEVDDNIEQAAERLAYARAALDDGDAALGAGDRNRAALAARGAEDASGQAQALIDEISTTRADLEQARSGFEAEKAELARDIPEAEAVVGAAAVPPAALAEALAAATAALNAAQADEAAGAMDPRAAFRSLSEASTRLDETLARYRDEAAQAQRAAAMLGQMMGAADSRIRAVSEFIVTRRGAIGPEARTRIAEAERYLQQAHAMSSADPVAALADAQRAIALADEASSLAQGDVADYRQAPYPGAPSGQPTFPGMGGGGGGGLGNLVLGGLLLDSMLRGSSGGGYGGRSPGMGGLTLGGFGGSGARRGGGGRF